MENSADTEPNSDSIVAAVREACERGDSMDACLDLILSGFDCSVGTVHRFDSDSQHLEILSQRGVPPALLEKVSRIPIGKGMAGLAAERREPVQVCNLQTDESGVAKPGAKETRMEGCISVPMLVGSALAGTLGIAKPVEYEFSPEETERLAAVASVLGAHVGD